MSDENCCGDCENCKDDSAQEEIHLDQDVYEDLIKLYVRKNMLPESNQVFNDYLLSGSSLEDAATKAMVEEIHLDQDVYEDLIKLYVRKNMLPESNQVFNDYLLSGSSLEDAATKAMVNDMANEVLAAVVADIAHANELIAAGNKEAGEAILNRYTFYNKNNKEDNTNDNSTEEEIPR